MVNRYLFVALVSLLSEVGWKVTSAVFKMNLCRSNHRLTVNFILAGLGCAIITIAAFYNNVQTLLPAAPQDKAETGLLQLSNSSNVYTYACRKQDEYNIRNIPQLVDEVLEKNAANMRGTKETIRDLVSIFPELFEKMPTKFLDNFKNPCWVRGKNELNCLPYFYIIGMRKCATTDLWDKLVRHRDIIKVPKEPHWWGPRRHGFKETPINGVQVLRTREITGGEDDMSLEWYLNLYKIYAIPDLLNYSTHSDGKREYFPRVFGDASISTAYTVGEDWLVKFPNASEPPYTTADLIRAVQPDAKIIFMIRNPTKRVFSWYWRNHRATAEQLHKDVQHYIKYFNDCLQTHTLRYCAYMEGRPPSLLPNFQVGIYYIFLLDWIKAFSKEGVLVISLEDWHDNRAAVFKRVLEFLELPQLSQTEASKLLRGSPVNAGNPSRHDKEWPETARLLNDFFRPYNEELAKVTGDPKHVYE